MIDFAQLKKDVPIECVLAFLDLPMTAENNQLRGQCPACKGGDRSLVVTPSKGVYYCFTEKKGGDLISLVSHAKQISLKDAAQFIADNVIKRPDDEAKVEEAGVLHPLTYLMMEHPHLEAIGLDADVCKKVGIGYAPKGSIRGYVAVPIRLPDGTLIGYIGIEDAKLPKKWRL